MRAGSDIEQQRQDRTSWMLTSLLLWLCTLPIVGLLILPWLGARAALIVAAALLVAAVTACYGICTWHVIDQKWGGRGE